MWSKRKKVWLALAGSVGIHLGVLFAWALAVQWFPAAEAASNPPSDPLDLQVVEEKPAETPPPEVVPTPAAIPTPKPPDARKIVFQDSTDLPEPSQPPKDSASQSDRNAEAASELPAAGDKPLPTQKGRPVPSFNFDIHPFTPGDEGQAAGQNVPQNMPPVPETVPPPPRPVSKPVAESTPPPAPSAAPADPRDLAMVTPTSIPSTPADAEPNPYDPSFRPPKGMTEPPRPTPVPRRGGYRPQQQRTETAGNVGKIGLDSAGSAATPLGQYTANVIRAVERCWHQYFDARADLVSIGVVQVHFIVERDGKIRTSHVVSNSGNEALASVALRALTDAPSLPMPPEVADSTDGGRLPLDITFSVESPTF